jgi:hypothetical protein
MRASFQGQNIAALGNGIARLQLPPLVADSPKEPQKSTASATNPKSQPKTPHQ